MSDRKMYRPLHRFLCTVLPAVVLTVGIATEAFTQPSTEATTTERSQRFPVVQGEQAKPPSDSLTEAVIASTKNTPQLQTKDSISPVSLDIYEYWVTDTSESVSFRLHIQNSSDSVVFLDHVEPSCGCIMTTIQKSLARKGKDAEVYIGLMTSRMSEIQPYTVDVYTSANPDVPLRLYIRKKIQEQTQHTE